MSAPDSSADNTPWILLIHQIPPKPDYLRVKVGRRLQRIGAVAVKNSVYLLPNRASSLEDFQWIRTEIVDGGGDASICQAAFVDGLTDDQIEQTFRDASDASFAEVAEEARELRNSIRRRGRESPRQSPVRSDELPRLRKRFATIAANDFFGAAGRSMAENSLRSLAEDLMALESAGSDAPDSARTAYRGRTWVTRGGIFIDRMSSAWLIRRFIDRDARFKFITDAKYKPARGELRFDMFEGEFTHEGERCTFETLLDRFQLDDDPALRAIAEIVHDIDLKDDKFGRDDAAGIERVFAGIVATTTDDMTRVERASQILDDLHSLITAELRG